MLPEWAPLLVRPGDEVIKKAKLLDKTADTTKVVVNKRDIEFIMLPRIPTVRRPAPPALPKIRLIIPRIEKPLTGQMKANADRGILPSLDFDVNVILRGIPHADCDTPAPLPPTSHIVDSPPALSDSARTTSAKTPIVLRLRRRPIQGFVPRRRQDVVV